MTSAGRQPNAPLDLPPPFLVGADDAGLPVEEECAERAAFAAVSVDSMPVDKATISKLSGAMLHPMDPVVTAMRKVTARPSHDSPRQGSR
jgi:hypothetical protein